jgi:hypothetical protein
MIGIGCTGYISSSFVRLLVTMKKEMKISNEKIALPSHDEVFIPSKGSAGGRND